MYNEKKLNYEEAKIEIIFFDSKDIVTTSGFDGVWDDDLTENNSNTNK